MGEDPLFGHFAPSQYATRLTNHVSTFPVHFLEYSWLQYLTIYLLKCTLKVYFPCLKHMFSLGLVKNLLPCGRWRGSNTHPLSFASLSRKYPIIVSQTFAYISLKSLLQSSGFNPARIYLQNMYLPCSENAYFLYVFSNSSYHHPLPHSVASLSCNYDYPIVVFPDFGIHVDLEIILKC